MILPGMPFGFIGGKKLSVANVFVADSGKSITIPTETQPGDLIVLAGGSRGNSISPTPAAWTPFGYTRIHTEAVGSLKVRLTVNAKVAVSGDAGSSSSVNGQLDESTALGVVRFDTPITGFSVVNTAAVILSTAFTTYNSGTLTLPSGSSGPSLAAVTGYVSGFQSGGSVIWPEADFLTAVGKTGVAGQLDTDGASTGRSVDVYGHVACGGYLELEA